MTLLLVDDDPSVLLTMAALLEDEGYKVRCAKSFAEARIAAESGFAFRCVLLDRSLGDGDGIELITEFRARMPGVSIVLMTGAPESVPPGAGADLILGKVDGLDRLFAHLRSLKP